SILHAARVCRAAADYIDDAAQAALESLRREDDTLDAVGWLELPEALRAPVLDTWLHAGGFGHPSDASRTELERQAADAASDSVPVVAWRNTEIRIWDGRLYAMPPLTALPEDWQSQWNGDALALPGDCGMLFLETESHQVDGAHFDRPLQVRLRRGGERIKPAGDPHTRELRDLFQRARMPPWLRARCPLIYEDDELIAVADLWISERGETIFDARGARPHWTRSACFRSRLG
ncbi:MAG TPA: tRNA lysidine(34) synthetase TilS, partial [Rhodanobacteraceae bacterium]|nr:tRNA lysidine(34) synthetase TilS [Rhodanobacteraceae bacterium]